MPVESAQRGVLDRGPDQPQLLPVRRPRRPRAPAWRGSSRWRAPGCGAAGCRPAPPGRPRERRHPDEGAGHRRPPSVAASTSARCMTRTPARCRDSSAADVHQAGVVAGDQHLGAGLADVAGLVGAHRHRGVGVLHRERAAEAAALLGARQVDQAQPAHRRAAAGAAGRRRRASAASGRSGGRSPGAGSTRRRRSRPARRRGTRDSS